MAGKRVVGVTWPNHVAFEVRLGMMDIAVRFFIEQLGWHEDPAGRLKRDWGEAAFVFPDTAKSFRVQLTCPVEGEDPRRITENHLALGVLYAEGAAQDIKAWADEAGYECEIEMVEAGKWFVHLPGIFAFSIELITEAWKRL